MVETKDTVEVCNGRGLAGRLLPCLFWIFECPVFVVAFNGKVKIEVLIVYSAWSSKCRADEAVQCNEDPENASVSMRSGVR